MDIQLTSTVVEIAAKDLQRALDFYRLLGLDVPEPDGPHVEVELPGGNKLAFDKEEIIAGMHPGWKPPTQPGPGRAGVPGERAVGGRRPVRAAHRSRASGRAETVRRAVGSALRDRHRSRRHVGRPLLPVVLTQRRERCSGEVTDLAVQVRLVGVAGRRGHACRRRSVVQQPDRAPEPQDAPQRRRPVAEHGGALALQRSARPPTSRATSATAAPFPRLSVMWLQLVKATRAPSHSRGRRMPVRWPARPTNGPAYLRRRGRPAGHGCCAARRRDAEQPG